MGDETVQSEEGIKIWSISIWNDSRITIVVVVGLRKSKQRFDFPSEIFVILRVHVWQNIVTKHQREGRDQEPEEFVVKCTNTGSYSFDRHIDEYFVDQPDRYQR